MYYCSIANTNIQYDASAIRALYTLNQILESKWSTASTAEKKPPKCIIYTCPGKNYIAQLPFFNCIFSKQMFHLQSGWMGFRLKDILWRELRDQLLVLIFSWDFLATAKVSTALSFGWYDWKRVIINIKYRQHDTLNHKKITANTRTFYFHITCFIVQYHHPQTK